MRSTSKGTILAACEMSFKGVSNSKIAERFKVTDSTVSRWRKLQVWIDFENELVAAYKAAALNTSHTDDAEGEDPNIRLG